MQDEPGLQSRLNPPADHGEESYKGTGKLKGKKAIITGGDSGIGRAVAIAFAREGADVLISFLEEVEDAKDTAKYVEEAGQKAILVKGDISDENHCKRIIQQAVDEFSIKMPARERQEHQPQPLELVEVQQEVRKKKLDRFRQRVREEITVDEINRYVEGLLERQNSLPLSEVPLETREHWVKLLYIILYSRSPRAIYTLTGQRGGSVSIRGGAVEVPALSLERKDSGA